jgi:nitrate/nitrite transporter NarK
LELFNFLSKDDVRMNRKEDETTLVVFTPILVGGFLAFFFLNILNSSYSTVIELIKTELDLTYTMTGALMSSYFVGYTIGQIPWGILADRIGCRKVITISVFGLALSTLLFSISSGFWQVIVARFLSGLLGAGVFVPSVRLVSDWFSSHRRGTALGILSIGGSLGLIVSSWIVPFYSLQMGWRSTIGISSVLGLAAASAIWFTLKDKRVWKKDVGNVDFKRIFVSKDFWIMAFVQFIRLGSNYTYIAWLPLLLIEEYEVSLVTAGVIYSLFNLSGMISNPVGGIISDSIGERSVLIITFITLGIFTYAFIGLKSHLFMYLWVIAIGWCINFLRSPSFTILPKYYGVEIAGKISGIHNTFAAAGALCFPLLLGLIVDTTSSYFAGWVLLSITLISTSTLITALKKP